MKRLLFSSLLLVTTISYGKPFKPSGYLSTEYKAYGETEHQNDKYSNHDTWNRGSNNYSRLQTYLGIQVTENFKIQGRFREYNNLERNDGTRDNYRSNGSDTRLRFYYRHNYFFTSRFEYRNFTSTSQKYEYQARLTVYKNRNGFLSSLLIIPKISYYFDKEGIDGDLTLGTNIEYRGNLPLGFTWDGTIYLDQHFYNNDTTNGLRKGDAHYRAFKKEFTTTWEFYLRRNWNLYKNDKIYVDFNFNSGYDPYTFKHYNRYYFDSTEKKSKKLGKNSYSLYTSLELMTKYNLTESLSLTAGIGAEYRNWNNRWQSTAQDWRWQPYAVAGIRVIF